MQQHKAARTPATACGCSRPACFLELNPLCNRNAHLALASALDSDSLLPQQQESCCPWCCTAQPHVHELVRKCQLRLADSSTHEPPVPLQGRCRGCSILAMHSRTRQYSNLALLTLLSSGCMH